MTWFGNTLCGSATQNLKSHNRSGATEGSRLHYSEAGFCAIEPAPRLCRRDPSVGARAHHTRRFGAAPPSGKQRFFVDLVAGEPSDGAQAPLSPRSAASPKPSEALPRFGLDIGRGTSGRPDGADAVRGHPRFLRESPSSSPSPACDDACRKRTGPSLHEHLLRDLAKPRRARRPARFRRGREIGRFTGSRSR
jgi:hypothetical protein